MKSLYLFAVIIAVAFSNVCFAEQENTEVQPFSETESQAFTEIEVKELIFEDLPKDSLIGNISDVINEEDSLVNALVERLKKKKTHFSMHPHAEGVSYINGQLCHVGNYPQSVIYTVLEGPYYGTQTTMNYYGAILFVNHDYVMEHTFGGVLLHHYYSDSEIVTGSTQIIQFY